MVNFKEEELDLDKANVSDHWGKEYQQQVLEVLRRHSGLFRPGLGMFNNGITMPILFRNEEEVLGLKQSAYNLSARDKAAVDDILNPLRADGRVEAVPLGQPLVASSPAFVVWKGDKPRVVVNLRKVNSRLYPDAYPLPRQDDVLAALGGKAVLSSADLTKSFFQQPIRPEDR